MEFSTLNSSSMVEIPRHSLRSFKVSKRWLCDDMSDFGLQRLIFAWTVLSVKKKPQRHHSPLQLILGKSECEKSLLEQSLHHMVCVRNI